MADIKDRIKKISNFFKGMQVDESDGQQIIYIMVEFPSNWRIQPETTTKFDVSIGEQDGLYYFCANLEQGFDILFDAIEYNIERMQTAMERAKLFREKTQELQTIFANEEITIEQLRTLDFNYKNKKKKITLPKTEEIKEEKIDEQ